MDSPLSTVNPDTPSSKGLHSQDHINTHRVNNDKPGAKLYPLMLKLILEQIEQVWILIPGVVTTIGVLMQDTGIRCFSTND
jgi:hypothetical protein